MSLTNQFPSTMHDDRMMPLDQRYTDFLNALSDIHDESMRDRCHKYWTSLYRYFDRSMTNEQALIVEEKRTHEILHRLDIEMVSHQSEIAYQVRHILQRGHQVLADLHIKYDRKKNSLREIKQHIDDLENRIQKQKSEHSFITDFTSVPSSTSLNQITETIDDLKLHIKNLQMTRTYDKIKSLIQLLQFYLKYQCCRRKFSNRTEYPKNQSCFNTNQGLWYPTEHP
jgi:archaellum component FlaC